MGMYLSSSEIRDLLNEAHLIKKDGKCIECNGSGYLNWNEDGEDIKPGYYSGTERDCGKCEACSGVGYIF